MTPVDRWRMVRGVAVLSSVMAALGFAALVIARDVGEVAELVFVCESDGELVENHVGVRRARPPGTFSQYAWRLIYTDGHRATYAQQPGETCYTERAAGGGQ